jgi:L-ascorbate metabolism protein UlaG (beta-lactamase superfamily)
MADMKIKWLGHASFLIKTKGKKIYIDPYAGDYEEEADVVLITHGHGDHCDLNKLSLVRRPDTTILTSEACAEAIPSDNITTMSPGDLEDIKGITIHAVEAYNYKRFRSPGIPYHPEGTQVGFIVESEGNRVYHAGDSDYLPSMKNLKGVTLALLPIMGRATMDLDEAVEATLGINPEMVMPMHRRDSDPMDFKRKVESRSDIKVIVMSEGEEITP